MWERFIFSFFSHNSFLVFFFPRFFPPFLSVWKKAQRTLKKSQCRQWIRNRQAKFAWRDATGFLFMFFCFFFLKSWCQQASLVPESHHLPAFLRVLSRSWSPISPFSLAQGLSSNMGSSLSMKPANISSVNIISITRVSVQTPGFRNSLHQIRTEWNEKKTIGPSFRSQRLTSFRASYTLPCVLQTPRCQC